MQDDENEQTGPQEGDGNGGANGNNGGNGGANGNNGGNGGGPEEADSGYGLIQDLKQAFVSAQLLVRFAAQRGVPDISGATNTILTSIERHQAGIWTVELETDFWTAYRSLVSAVRLATVESISLSARGWRGTGFIRKTVRNYTIATLAVLVFLIATQWGWTKGVGYISRIGELNKTIAKLETSFNKIRIKLEKTELVITRLPTPARSDAAGQKDDPNLEKLELEKIDTKGDLLLVKDRLDQAKARRTIIVQELIAWDRTPGVFDLIASAMAAVGEFFSPQKLEDIPPPTTWTAGVPPGTESGVHAISTFILPAIYGLLGSLAFILRSLVTQIRNVSFTTDSLIRFQLRWPLGLLAGIAIGWFSGPIAGALGESGEPLSQQIATFQPFALAFLAGFSVEVLFTGLDRLVATFTGDDKPRGQN